MFKRVLMIMTLSLVFFLLAGTASAGSYGGGSVGVEDRRRANVLLITMDDIGWDLLNTGFRHPLYNTMSTPNIQNLMDEGVTFLQGSAEAWCVPTRWELLTGIDVLTNGTDDGLGQIQVGSRFDINTPFLPQYLQATDYITYGSGKNGIAGGGVMELGQTLVGSTATWNPGPTQGWDHALMWPFSQANNQLWCGMWVMEVVSGAAVTDGTPPTFGQPYLGDCSTNAVWQDLGYVNRAKAYLDDHYANFATNPHDAPPFFLWMSFLSPHIPVTRHPGVSLDLTDPVNDLGTGMNSWMSNTCTRDGPGGALNGMTPQDCIIAHVESVDTLIGTLLAHITPAQMADTLIILHGDNGTQPEFTRDQTENAIADNTTNASCVSTGAVPGSGCAGDDLNLWVNNCPVSGQPGANCSNRVTGSGKGLIDHTSTWVPFIVAGGQVSTANWGLTSNAPVSMKDINETILTEAIRGFTRTPGFVPIEGTANNILTALQDPSNPCSGNPNPCDAVSKFNVTSANAAPAITQSSQGRSVVDNEGFRYYETADVMYNVIADQFQTTPLCTALSCAATVGANADKLTALKAELARFGTCSEAGGSGSTPC